MKIGDFSYPLYLNKKEMLSQMILLGMTFNRYNNTFESKTKSFRCFCIALNKNKIVSIGINKSKTTPKYPRYAHDNKLTIHAEIDMMLNIKHEDDFASITEIGIVRGFQNPLPSLPCNLCLDYLRERFDSSVLITYMGMDLNWYSKRLGLIE